MQDEPTEGQYDEGAQRAMLAPAQAAIPATMDLSNPAQVEQAIGRLRCTAQYVRGELEVMRELIKSTFMDGVHMGVIPGTEKKDQQGKIIPGKPVLYKPGAELLVRMFRLRPVTADRKGTWDPDAECVVEVWEWIDRKRSKVPKTLKGFLRHTITIQILREDGMVIAEATGTANSWEKKYYWAEPLDVDNTILQMAYKRAFVQAVRQATATSGYFSVDEEMYARPEGNSDDVARAEGVQVANDPSELSARQAIANDVANQVGIPAGEVLATFNRLDWNEVSLRDHYQTPAPKAAPAAAPAPPAAPAKKSSSFIDL